VPLAPGFPYGIEKRTHIPHSIKEVILMADHIIGKVFSLISGNEEPDSDNKILLRQVVKEISQNKYGKFCRQKTEEVDPSFASYIYDVYKIVYPACSFVQNTAKVTRMKQITVEAFMNKENLELLRRLRPEMVQERVKKLNAPEEASRQLKEDLASLSTAFDNARVANMNRCYNLITALIQFAQFNFLSILRRFDTSLPEGNVGYTPRFQPAKAADLIEEMGNFRTLIQNLEPSDDWKFALAVMKIARDGQELIPLSQWNMLLMNLREFKNSNIIELIGQFTTKNPIWQIKYHTIDEQMVETWIEAKQAEVQEVIDHILTKQRNTKIEQCAVAVFGTSKITKLQYYNRETNDICVEKGLEGFLYAVAANYLIAFIQDFITKEMQELCDILLVRGQWINNTLSLEMSTAVHTITDVTDPIMELDEILSDTGTYGLRFKNALSRAERDKVQARFVNHIAGELDDKAEELIKSATQGLVVVGKHMKNLLGDSQKSPPEIIINWKELGYFTKNPMIQRLTDTYTRINYFVQLMLLLTNSQTA
jgi:ribosomal protein S16